LLNPAPSHQRLRIILVWVTTIVWAGVIYWLSTETFGGRLSAWLLTQLLWLLHIHVSAATFATLHFLLRKLAHLVEYAIFSLFLYYSFAGNQPPAWRLRRAFWAVLAAGLYSLTDEYHQYFVPGRSASLLDCGIDTLGAIAGMVVLYGHDRPSQAKSKSSAAESARMEEAAKGVAGE
jgi:VanZ family protein